MGKTWLIELRKSLNKKIVFHELYAAYKELLKKMFGGYLKN